MISLELTFTDGTGGYSADPLIYRQVKRNAKVAIYQRFYSDGRPKDFEVFRINIDPKGKVQKFPGGVIKVVPDDTEKYPSTGQFGFSAWSFSNLGAAEARFEKLCSEDDAPEVVEKVITLPLGEFSITDLATANGVPYSQAAQFVKAGLEDKSIIFTREERRAAKGKATKLYSKA